jgi:hypothetical protein
MILTEGVSVLNNAPYINTHRSISDRVKFNICKSPEGKSMARHIAFWKQVEFGPSLTAQISQDQFWGSRKRKNVYSPNTVDAERKGFAYVLNVNSCPRRVCIVEAGAGGHSARDVGSQFLPRMSLGLLDSIIRNLGGFFSLYDRVASGDSSVFRVKERAIDQNNSGERNDRLDKADTEHPFGPKSHVLLGLQIVASAFLFVGGFLACISGIKRVTNALDVVLNGDRKGWVWVGCYSGLGLLGTGLCAAVPTYWLSVCASC